MKTPYLRYLDELDRFMECQTPIKVTKTYSKPGFDIWDTPSELYESVLTEADDDDGGEEADTDTDTDVDADADAAVDADADADVSDDGAIADDGMYMGDGGDMADDGTGDMDMTAEDTSAENGDTEVADSDAAGELNSDGKQSSVSAEQLFKELTADPKDNVFTRTAKAAKAAGLSGSVKPTELFKFIAESITEFMHNRNYAAISRAAMRALIFKIAATMANPPKKKEAEKPQQNSQPAQTEEAPSEGGETETAAAEEAPTEEAPVEA